MRPKFRNVLVGWALATVVVSNVIAEDWPRWRGPDGNGVSPESGWRAEWSDEPAILWKTNIGTGYSSAVVSGGKLYILGLEGKRREVFRCLDASTGDEIWQHSYKTSFKPKFYDGGTSGTATVDGDAVYLLAQTGEVFSLGAADGKVRWEANVADEGEIGIWGLTGAPLVYGDKIVLNAGKSGIALNRKDGKVVWRTGKGKNGYATPVLHQFGGRDALAVFASDGAYGIGPDDGKKLWEQKWKTQYEVNAADPVFFEQDKKMFISSGYNRGCALFSMGASGPVKLWENKELRTQFNPSVFVDGYLYGVDGDTASRSKTFTCLDAKTGKAMWKEKGIGSGSVIAAGGRLIVLSEGGEVITVKPNPKKFDEISRAQVLPKKCWTTPALANGLLYCRNQKGDLVCVDLRRN